GKRRNQMKTTSNTFSKSRLSLAAALALSIAAAGVARANPVFTTTDEARAFAAAPISRPGVATIPVNGAVFGTDEARPLAGRMGSGADQHEEGARTQAVGGVIRRVAHFDGLQAESPVHTDERGVETDADVLGPPDLLDEIVGHAHAQGSAAHEQRHRRHVPRQMHGRLARGITGADEEDVL